MRNLPKNLSLSPAYTHLPKVYSNVHRKVRRTRGQRRNHRQQTATAAPEGSSMISEQRSLTTNYHSTQHSNEFIKQVSNPLFTSPVAYGIRKHTPNFFTSHQIKRLFFLNLFLSFIHPSFSDSGQCDNHEFVLVDKRQKLIRAVQR